MLRRHPSKTVKKSYKPVTFDKDDSAIYYSDLFQENFPIDADGRTCVVDFHESGTAPKDLMRLALLPYPNLSTLIQSKLPWDLESSNIPSLSLARYMFGVGSCG